MHIINIFIKTSKLIIFIILLICSTNVNAISKVDSLKNIVNSRVNDTIRIKALNDLSKEFVDNNPKLAVKYCFQGLQLASKINYKKGIADIINILAAIYFNKSKYEIALKMYNISAQLNKQLNNQPGAVISLNGIGNIYSIYGDYQKALEYYKEVIEISQKYDYKQNMAMGLNNIGIIYSKIGKPAEAIDNYQKALLIYDKLNNLSGKATILVNIANIYNDQNNFKQANFFYNEALNICLKKDNKYKSSIILINLSDINLKQGDLNKALNYALKALHISEEFENYSLKAYSLHKISIIYSKMNNIKQAEQYLMKALNMMKMVNDKTGESLILNSLADIYLKDSQYQKTIYYALLSIKIAKDDHNLQSIKDAYKTLSDAYYLLGDYKNAYMYHKYFKEINDSIYNIEINQKIQEISAQYKDDQQKKEIELLNERAKTQDLIIKETIIRKKLQNFIFIFIIVSIIAIFILIYQRNKHKQKIAVAKTIAEQEKTRFKEIIEAQEQERKRIASDLHDGVGMLLATAKLNLSVLEEKITDSEESEMLKKSQELIAQSYNEVRNISHNLMPGVLIELGLIAAIKDLCDKISILGKLLVTLKTDQISQKVSETLGIAVYRILQEVLLNILKHAHANKIDVLINITDAKITINISDNGIGFNINGIDTKYGIGWKNISSRINMLNGTISVNSIINKGTIIEILIPLVKL